MRKSKLLIDSLLPFKLGLTMSLAYFEKQSNSQIAKIGYDKLSFSTILKATGVVAANLAIDGLTYAQLILSVAGELNPSPENLTLSVANLGTRLALMYKSYNKLEYETTIGREKALNEYNIRTLIKDHK